jgi:hypothetical protein
VLKSVGSEIVTLRQAHGTLHMGFNADGSPKTPAEVSDKLLEGRFQMTFVGK